MKVPQLRNAYERVGLDLTQMTSNAGFGFLHDGAVDSIARMIDVFAVQDLQELADVLAFVVSMSGSDLPVGNTYDVGELRGPDSQDTHAAVGAQVTFGDAPDAATIARFDLLRGIAATGAVGLVAKGVLNGEHRGFFLVPPGTMQSDRAGEQTNIDVLRLSAARRAEITFTVVPAGTQTRIGVDRDEDGFFDRDELDACSDPAVPASTPANSPGCPPLGLCCLPGGECVDHVEEETCSSAGGTYGGDGQRCVDYVCSIRRGACCFGPDTCLENAREVDCGLAGGRYAGDSTTCAGATCSVCGDFNGDLATDSDDLAIFRACSTGPTVLYNSTALPSGCALASDTEGKIKPDSDGDGDVDADDFGALQRCYGE
jgi:hypothetical protein